MTQILDGHALAETLRAEIAAQVAEFKAATGVIPHLAAVLCGDDPASAVYVRNKQRACEKAGFASTLEKLPADITQSELLDTIARFNTDPAIHGILIQLPLPKQIDPQAVLDAVTPAKDVDCFHPENVGLLVQGRPRFLPCTPHAVQQVLHHAGILTAGTHVVVIGRSEIVGKPLAIMFGQKGPTANATVTLCHSHTRNLAELTRLADILVAAIGVPQFVTADMVRPGAVVIDVGINRVGDKLVGDADFANVSPLASAITPVPRGIGPMTITMLLKNTLTAARLAAAR